MLYTEDFSMRHYVGFSQIGSHIIIKWPQDSNWLVTCAGGSNLIIKLIKAQKIIANYS